MTQNTKLTDHARTRKERQRGQACNVQTETHLHLVTVEKVDVGFMLLFVLANQKQHGRVTCLIQDRLTHLDGWERKVLQLLLQKFNRGRVRGENNVFIYLFKERIHCP